MCDRFKHCTQKRSIRRAEKQREERKERELVATCKTVWSFFSFSFTLSCKWGREDALSLRRLLQERRPSLEFGADRARQRETKAGIRESRHCNWRRDRKRMATDRDRGRNTQRGSQRRRRSVGCESVIFTPRPRARAWYERVGTDPALLLLFGVIPVGLLDQHGPLPL